MERLAVFASGSGTTLEAFVAAQIPIALVVVDRPCRALDIARAALVPAVLINRAEFGMPKSFDRTRYTREVSKTLREHRINLVALAGFMTILGPEVCREYDHRMINSHPALLPKHRGAHAVRDTLRSGDAISGYTIHYVTPLVDEGEMITQEQVPVLPGDTEKSLHGRIKEKERVGYVSVLKNLLAIK